MNGDTSISTLNRAYQQRCMLLCHKYQSHSIFTGDYIDTAHGLFSNYVVIVAKDDTPPLRQDSVHIHVVFITTQLENHIQMLLVPKHVLVVL